VPELPEVETIRRQLAPRLEGREVVAGGAHPSPKFATAVDALGGRITTLTRRGKYLIAELDHDQDLVVHLGMTGVLALDAGAEPAPSPYLRAWWALAGDGARGPEVLTFTDVRRFGRTVVVPHAQHGALPTLAGLGPEPLGDDFTPAHLATGLRRGGAPLKAVLLGQRVVAGVGNIYCDEACWRAGVHPGSRKVPAAKVPALHAAIRAVLAEGIDHGGTTLRDYRDGEGGSGSHQRHLDCYGRAGEPCNRCGAPLERSVVAARGTTSCPTCQPRRGLRPRPAVGTGTTARRRLTQDRTPAGR
jgi:formamidopyrimidine-DNA glycosylase